MKHLKSGYQDLLRLFQQSITVREIAEPLVSFEADIASEKVSSFMKDRDFDVVGVRTDGVISAFVQADNLGEGAVGNYAKAIAKNRILDESAPLDRALDALKDSRWVFVRFLGRPSGIITRGDLQKAPLRMWLFGLISLLEMQLLRQIRQAYPNEGWSRHLSPQRLSEATRIYKERERRNEGIDLAECLQIGDKARIYEKSADLWSLLPFESKNKWSAFAKKVESLRNRLAHSNPIPSNTWPEIALLVEEITRCFEKLEAKR